MNKMKDACGSRDVSVLQFDLDEDKNNILEKLHAHYVVWRHKKHPLQQEMSQK